MCEITAPINGFSCDRAGGVDTWYAFSRYDATGASNIATLTVTNGAVTALTLATGKYAYPINVEQETSSATDTAIGERGNNAYAREMSATLALHGNTAEMITAIENLCKGRTTLIAKMNDGTYEVFFLNFGAKCSDERTTGTSFEDMNGNTLTFTGRDTAKAPKISSVIVEALLEP